MALIKKLITIGGTSRGIILPKSWLLFHEKKNRQKIRKVGVEINGKIVIWPILKEWFLAYETQKLMQRLFKKINTKL